MLVPIEWRMDIAADDFGFVHIGRVGTKLVEYGIRGFFLDRIPAL